MTETIRNIFVKQLIRHDMGERISPCDELRNNVFLVYRILQRSSIFRMWDSNSRQKQFNRQLGYFNIGSLS